MSTGIESGLYRLLLALHILCAAVGFGSVAMNGLFRLRARQRGADELVLLQENAYMTRTAEFLMYAAFVFGILVAATSKSVWKFDQSWLSIAMLLFIVEIGLLHGFIHRTEKEYN